MENIHGSNRKKEKKKKKERLTLVLYTYEASRQIDRSRGPNETRVDVCNGTE